MLLAPIPWAGRVWALPFLTGLAPSQRDAQERGRPHQKLTEWARQIVWQARRWMPDRALVLVADRCLAALKLLAAVTHQGVIGVTRLRLDAALYEPAPPPRGSSPRAKGPRCGSKGRPPPKSRRLPNLTTMLAAATTRWPRGRGPGWHGAGDRLVAFCSATAVGAIPGCPSRRSAGFCGAIPGAALIRRRCCAPIPRVSRCRSSPGTSGAGRSTSLLSLSKSREVRDHRGVETQRQGSDRAIARTTPCLLALFSRVALLAVRLDPKTRPAVTTAAWYRKPHPTFADTLAAVRRQFWQEQGFFTSHPTAEEQKPQPTLHEAIVYALCNAA